MWRARGHTLREPRAASRPCPAAAGTASSEYSGEDPLPMFHRQSVLLPDALLEQYNCA